VELLLRFSADLVFVLPEPSAALEQLVRRHYRAQVDNGAAPAGAVVVGTGPPPWCDPGVVVLEERPIVVRRSDGGIRIETPGVLAWCDPLGERAGLRVDDPDPGSLELFVARALPALLAELAAARGHLALHAAAVAPRGRGVLLPGPSGSGKTTVFSSCHRAGIAVLSDDLVWVRELASGFQVVAFERGVPKLPVASPTLPTAPVVAVVLPTIRAVGASDLQPVTVQDAVPSVIAQSSFLGSGPVTGAGFRTLVRLAATVPAFRLLAGPDLSEAPRLIAALSRRL
jgi:hypothetical protein